MSLWNKNKNLQYVTTNKKQLHTSLALANKNSTYLVFVTIFIELWNTKQKEIHKEIVFCWQKVVIFMKISRQRIE